VAAVAARLAAYREPGPKYMVLATDGEPDTCPGSCLGDDCPVPDSAGWPRDPQCGQDRSIAAVQAAFAQGIRTFVIGLGDDVGAAHLQALANAGAGLPVVLTADEVQRYTDDCRIPPGGLHASYGGPGPNARYFAPADQRQLAQALRAVVGMVRSCKLVLQGRIAPDHAAEGWVAIDGRPLLYGGPDGWRLDGPSQLEVLGAACDALLATPTTTLTVAFPCTAFAP
jgi:hypothetical protein